MAILTKDQILSADDLKRVKVSVPEWGGDVYVSTLTGTERDRFEQSIITDGKADLGNIRAKLCGMVIVDVKGVRLFGDKDITILGKKSAAALDRVFSTAQELNGLTAADVEELAKNSGPGQSEGSISD